ncbi:RAVE subunit 2/Rogdi [Myxozyma melibiosi]|uniref:RAVE subunit 2/Rogdi n=1 Tax=Myxozyma melibiosi TaxID=54550 RepID=A0ABR1FAR1_9ASCO
MTTTVYPALDASSALNEEHKVSILELAWLLRDLSTTMKSLYDGLDECIALMQSDQPGSTLVLSSNRSEALKGFVVRQGKNITKAEIHLKLSSLNKGTVLHLILAEGKVIPLAQLNDCTNFLSVCLQVVKEMDFVEPAVVLSQLRKLLSNIRNAHISIRSVSPAFQFPYSTIDPAVFVSEMPPNVGLDLILSESGVIADIRTLQILDSPPPSSQLASSGASIASTARFSTTASSVYRGGSTSSRSVAGQRASSSSSRPTPPNVATIFSTTGGPGQSPAQPAQAQTQPSSTTANPSTPSELTRTTTNASVASSIATVSSTMSTASTKSWFSGIMGRKRMPDPANLFMYRGQYVKPLERITVQSLDPGLMTLISKLNGEYFCCLFSEDSC